MTHRLWPLFTSWESKLGPHFLNILFSWIAVQQLSCQRHKKLGAWNHHLRDQKCNDRINQRSCHFLMILLKKAVQAQNVPIPFLSNIILIQWTSWSIAHSINVESHVLELANHLITFGLMENVQKLEHSFAEEKLHGFLQKEPLNVPNSTARLFTV